MGRIPTNATSTEILRVSHTAVLRWAPPGVMLTMDFRADRVTVHLGPDHKITQINCG
ncbi:MAG: I78 family peptidase inhibitor [Sphingomicrobium sp.]